MCCPLRVLARVLTGGPLLVPLAAPLTGQAPPQADVDAAIERGVDFLLSEQQPDGSWLYFNHPRPGCSALIVYALLKSGVDPEHEAIERALRRLSVDEVAMTYDAACLIMALTALDVDEHWGWIQELAEDLLSWQTAAGHWGYPGGRDLSNTQYAALGLRAAALAGVEIPTEAWARLVDALDRFRESGGGYSYSPAGTGATGTMTAAGVGTLAICDAMLTEAGELSSGEARTLRGRRDKGLDWLGDRAGMMLSAGGGRPYYRLYGIERVGAFVGITDIGDEDWYATGATALLEAQLASGGWGNQRVVVNAPGQGTVIDAPGLPETCFALLFLRRATHGSITGRYGRAAARHFGTKDPGADVQVSTSGEFPLTIWIAGWGAAARERLEWPRDKGKGPRVVRVEYLANERVIATVEGDGKRPARGERFPLQHRFPVAGTYALKARVHVLAPPTDEEPRGSSTTIESPAFSVPIENVVPDWVLLQEGDRAKNLLPDAEPRASASSVFPGGLGLPTGPYAASNAADHRAHTCWLADPDDEKPTLNIVLSRPVRADVILLSNALSVPYRPGFFARALELDVTINGRDRHSVRMAPDERRKGRIELDEPVSIRRLDVHVRWKVAGEVHPCVGLAEVELQKRD